MEKIDVPTCTWTLEEFDSDTYDTSCRHRFSINDGTPSENDINFCCYCGGKLIEETK